MKSEEGEVAEITSALETDAISENSNYADTHFKSSFTFLLFRKLQSPTPAMIKP
jgi:hypothetical protein